MSCSPSRLTRAHSLFPIFGCPSTAVRTGETPSACAIECCNKHPNVDKWLTIMQALTSLSTEVERRRVAVMLSVSTPATLLIPPASVVPPQRLPDGQLSPVLSVQHAAPVLIRPSESASLLQMAPLNQPSAELGGLLPKSSDDEGCKLRPIKAVSFSNAPSAGWRLPKAKASAPHLVLKPCITQASSLHILSGEGWWQTCRELPNTTEKPERRDDSVINKEMGSNKTKRLPSAKTTAALPFSPSIRSLWEYSLRHPSPELVAQVLKPPNGMAVQRPLFKIVINTRRLGEPHHILCCEISSLRLVFRCRCTALEAGS